MEKIRIALFIDKQDNLMVGGGYSYIQKMTSLIDKYEFNPIIQFIYFQEYRIAKHWDKETIYFSDSPAGDILYKILFNIKKFFSIFPSFIFSNFRKQIRKSLFTRRENHLIKILKKNKIDLIYYLYPTNDVIDYPFIMTHWDIGHRSCFAFPEFAKKSKFEDREIFYQKILPRAFFIFVESFSGKEELVRFTGINENRIFVLPIFPGRVVDINIQKDDELCILNKFSLDTNQYFLYPAQFWAHKNHFILLRLAMRFQQNGINFKIILTGSDKGNLSYILRLINNYNLENFVSYFGFVTDAELYVLYKNARALIFPSFLGPTNMPLLEANIIGCKVICSDLKGHREILGDSAIYFDPIDDECLFSRIQNYLKISSLVSSELIEKGNKTRNTILELERHLLGMYNLIKCC